MPIVHSFGKTMNKDYTITIQSTITKCFPALIFWLCFHYLVPKRLPREVNLRCAQSGEKELRPPGVTSFLSSSRGLSRFVTSYSRVSQPKCVMKHLIAGAGRCIQVPCWGRYRGLKSIKTCERNGKLTYMELLRPFTWDFVWKFPRMEFRKRRICSRVDTQR